MTVGAAVAKFLLDLFFPPYCGGCGRLGTLLCATCYQELNWLNQPLKLKLPTNFLTTIHVACRYQEPMRRMLKLYKYQGIKDYGQLLGQLLYFCCPLPPVQAVTWVPLHPQKLGQRGFNQAQLIAQAYAQAAQLPAVSLLNRTTLTPSQASLKDKDQRLQRQTGQFTLSTTGQVWLRENSLQSLLIIDDVITTGATLNACAQVCVAASIVQIHGLAIAHGH